MDIEDWGVDLLWLLIYFHIGGATTDVFCIAWKACLKSPFVTMPLWSGTSVPCREGPEYPFFKTEALFPFILKTEVCTDN